MQPIKPSTSRQLHTLLSRTGQMDNKREMIKEATQGRTESARDLYEHEAISMIHGLQQQPAAQQRTPGKKAKADSADKMRKKILAICHQLGWYQRDEHGALILKDDKPQIDFKRIDEFTTTRCPGHKALQKYNAAELPAVVTVFNNVLNSL